MPNSCKYFLKPINERFPSSGLTKREDGYLNSYRRINRITNLPVPNKKLQIIVVVPTLNEELLIRQSLHSLITQEIPANSLEILVIDNGSTDLTKSIVLDISRQSHVPVLLISQPVPGCLQAIKKGMDIAVQRFSKISPPDKGIIASIDADCCVGPQWANSIIQTFVEKRVDMIRGKTRVVPPLLPDIERRVKELCDLGNRVNAYFELVRLRIREKLEGFSSPGLPIWLPRITGPNIAITRPAYIAVGGLNSRCTGDQASILANPLLQMGGTFLINEDANMVLDISYRFSKREGNLGRIYGNRGFGALLEFASSTTYGRGEATYPNPDKLEDGFCRIIPDLESQDAISRNHARQVASQISNFPSDPNLLFDYTELSGKPEYVPFIEAKSKLTRMTTCSGGMDYRNAERFLMAREHLRAEILSCQDLDIDPHKVLSGFLKRSGASFSSLPLHLRKVGNKLLEIAYKDKEGWYSKACDVMQEYYAKVLTLE